MKQFNRYRSMLTGVIAFVWLGCEEAPMTESGVEALPYYGEASFTPNWETPSTYFHKIPSFELINQNGDTVSNATFQDKVYIADFFFTSCPGICPAMTDNMALIQEDFRDDPNVLLISHSVTPEKDSVSVLKEYAELKGVDADKWHLVTGDRSLIYGLGRKGYFVEEDLGLEKQDDEFLHTENFVLVDGNGHIRGIYNGLKKSSVRTLIADVRTLMEQG